MASARAVQYARTLRPDELRVVHFNIDTAATEELKEEWSRLGLAHLPLDILECRDRRLERAALEYVADLAADGKTECTVLLPRRAFHSRLAARAPRPHRGPHRGRRRHRRTRRGDDRPLQRRGAHRGGRSGRSAVRPEVARRKPLGGSGVDRELARRATGTTPINDVAFRARASGSPDGSGRCVCRPPRARRTSSARSPTTPAILLLVFQGRPKIPGIEPGARLIVEGMVGSW